MPVAGVPPNADPGDRPRAEGEGLKAEAGGALGRTRSRGDGGSGRAVSRDGENDSFAFEASLLGFVELGP